MLASSSCYPAEPGGEQKIITNTAETIPILSFRCTSWGVSCISLLNALSCVILTSLPGNSISLCGHPFCCSCSSVSQRMESGSPALVKFCELQHQQEKSEEWEISRHPTTLPSSRTTSAGSLGYWWRKEGLIEQGGHETLPECCPPAPPWSRPALVQFAGCLSIH